MTTPKETETEHCKVYTQKVKNKDTRLNVRTSDVARDVKVDAYKFALQQNTHSQETNLK